MPIPAVRHYPWAMFADFSPVQPMPLTLVTPGLVINGTVMSRIRRLTDMMNDPDYERIVVQDAVLTDIESGELLSRGQAAQVQRSDVLFVHTSAETESTPVLRTAKTPVDATIWIWPYLIRGTIHLGYDPQLARALADLSEDWLPVTGARYLSRHSIAQPTPADLLVLNHARAHIVIPASVEWNPTAPDVSSASLDPW